MKLNTVIISVAIGLCLLITSCEKVIEFDIPEAEPVLVLNGYVGMNELVEINVSTSLSYLEGGSPQTFSELSSIELYKDGVFLEDLELIEPDFGRYASTNPISSTGLYEVRASAADYESVMAVTQVPEVLENIQVETLNIFSDGQAEYELSFDEPPSEGDYYHMLVVTPESDFQPAFAIEFSSNSEVFISSGFDFDLEGENFIFEEGIFTDELVNGTNVKIRFKAQSGLPKEVQLVKCSEDYYFYHRSIIAYNNSEGPFSVPVQVYTNVENGLGAVAGYNFSSVAIIE